MDFEFKQHVRAKSKYVCKGGWEELYVFRFFFNGLFVVFGGLLGVFYWIFMVFGWF